jgi:hypothetical protein
MESLQKWEARKKYCSRPREGMDKANTHLMYVNCYIGSLELELFKVIMTGSFRPNFRLFRNTMWDKERIFGNLCQITIALCLNTSDK